MNTLVVIGFVVAFLLLAVFLYLRLRDSPGNFLRRARRHHKKGEMYHSKGQSDKAELHYEIAKEYRERALKGEKDGMV